MSNSAVDRDRLEAYQRKMNNPAEMLVGNVVIGSMIGMFVGYMSGAAFGVYKWKLSVGAKTTSLGAGIGILVGGAVNGFYTLQKGGSASNFRAADLQQPKRKGVTELQQDLEYIRQRERETGESMERQKKVVKTMLANEEKMAAMMRRQ